MLSRLRLLLLALLVLLAWPRAAWAIEYEVFVDAENEDELYDLLLSEQISEDTFNLLLELHRRGVDLNTATREQLYSLPNLTYDDVDAILAYRTEVGVIHAPADLVAAGVLSRAKLASILMFIQATDARAKWTATHGFVRYMTAYSPTDGMVPPMMLQARVTTLRQLTIGATALLTRFESQPPIWDPVRESLMVPELGPRVRVPRVFVEWNGEKFGAIVGHYQIGFGQRLTLDTTSRYTPNGFVVEDANRVQADMTRRCRETAGELPETPCPQSDGIPYATKDFYWREAFRGVALGAKHLSLPVGWMQVYAFGSWQTRKQYQYDLIDERTCDGIDCSGPRLLVLREDRLAPTAGLQDTTMPALFDELLGGGNISWFHDRRTHVGITGYGAHVLWRVEGAELDFSPNARTPLGGPFGAIGVDATWGRGWSDLGVELSRSFDSERSFFDSKYGGGDYATYGGGGYAGIIRQTSTFGSHELELSARYYDENYNNPYASPISQPDESWGLRARDEAGGRIRYVGRIRDRLDLRGLIDVWTEPSELAPRMQAYLRSDVDANAWIRPGLWLEYRNVDLRPNRFVGCYKDDSEIESDADDDGDEESADVVSNCRAEVGKVTARVGFRPWKGKLAILAQYRHDLVHDVSVDYLRQDANLLFTVRVNPVSGLNLAARLRFRAEDIREKDRLEESVWAYFTASYLIKRVFLIRARYDLYQWLDTRDSTSLRSPNPEHRLRLELEARF